MTEPNDPKDLEKNFEIPQETVDQIKQSILSSVGYRRPPEHTRFKKGQSGNPKGRPKSKLSTEAISIVLAEAKRLVTVRDGEETRKIPAIQAVIRSQYVTATKGNAHAQKHIVEFTNRAQREEKQCIKDDIELAENYITVKRKEIQDAIQRGETPLDPIPHPDDLIIDYDEGVFIKGPITPEGVGATYKLIRFIDILLMQDILDERCGPSKYENYQSGGALLFATRLNRTLPKRLKLEDFTICLTQALYEKMPKRVLLKQVRRAWREQGIPAPRGFVFPTLPFFEEAFKRGEELWEEEQQNKE